MRETLQGEQLGLSLFNFKKAFQIPGTMNFCLDNWAIASYGKGLAMLGDKDRLTRLTDSCYRYGQSLDTFTAYESVEADNGKETGIACTDWCVPAQLVYPRLVKFLQHIAP